MKQQRTGYTKHYIMKAKANKIRNATKVEEDGILGKDTLEESDFTDYNELLDLNIGKCYFAVARLSRI